MASDKSLIEHLDDANEAIIEKNYHQAMLSYLHAFGCNKAKPDEQMGFLLEIMDMMVKYPDEIPTTRDDAWSFENIVRYFFLSHVLEYQPELKKLKNLLQNTHQLSLSAKLKFEADLHGIRGEFEQAKTVLERAKAEAVTDTDTVATNPSGIAKYARLIPDLEQAKSWLLAAEEAFESHRCSGCETVYARESLELNLALDKPIDELRQEAEDFEELLWSHNDSSSVQSIIVKIALKDPTQGDPGLKEHRAYQDLSKKVKSDKNAYWPSERSRLVLSLRIAAIQFTQKQLEQDKNNLALQQELQRRIKKAWTSYNIALRHAAYLDEKLECTYRQDLVKSHKSTLEQFSKY